MKSDCIADFIPDNLSPAEGGIGAASANIVICRDLEALARIDPG